MVAILEGFPTPIGCALVPGGAPGAIAPVGGIDPADSLIDVRHISTDLTTNASLLGEASITGADEITLSTTDTSGDFLLVTWKEER